MVKKTLSILSFVILFTSVEAQNEIHSSKKLSPITKRYLASAETAEKQKSSYDYVYKNISGKKYLSGMIKVNENIDPIALSSLNIITGTKAGNIWTVQIPPENLKAFTMIKGIEYIQLDEPVFMNLDSARHDTHTDSVHQGIMLPQAYTGKDVVVGIIDAGFDYTHPAFLDSSGNNCRIVKVWEQKTTGSPPNGYLYGNEISDSTSLFSDGFDVDLFSHGTHVAGIAAGSGYGSSAGNSKYRGIAFESELIFVGIKPDPDQWTTTGASNIIDGINYIFQYADSVGKPAVVNLSWGCSMGSHDGTSLFSQAVDNLTGEGKIFVCAAGNNGTNSIHLNKYFSPNDSLLKTVLTFSTYLSSKKTWVDAWGEESQNFCAEVTLYNGSVAGNSTGFICLDDSIHTLFLLGSTGDTCYVTITTSSSDFNGKPRLFFDFYSKTTNRVMLTLKGYNGSVNMWMGYVKDYTGYYGSFNAGGIPGATTGNKDMTISDFASTHSAIAAAAYASKTTYTNIDGQFNSYNTYVTEGNITPFSSHGPSADSLVKPDISAPGMVLVSAINSFDPSYYSGGSNRSEVIDCFTDSVNSRDYCYAAMSGTSMASPMTAGIIALLLEANPTLTPALVRYILQSTAITDNYTGTISSSGSNLWGYGKINAYSAVKKAWSDANVQNILSNELNCMIYPNPNSGSFYIEYISESNEEITVEVIDILGSILHTQKWNLITGINKKTIEIYGLHKGIYFTRLSGNKGNSVFKMIVE